MSTKISQKPNSNPSAGSAKLPVCSSHGYIQKGNRYFWKIGATTKFNQGFKAKEDCDNWINEVRDKYGFDWRVGFMVKFKKFDEPWVLVTRKGIEVKC